MSTVWVQIAHYSPQGNERSDRQKANEIDGEQPYWIQTGSSKYGTDEEED